LSERTASYAARISGASAPDMMGDSVEGLGDLWG
jgi:hypothetical protein